MEWFPLFVLGSSYFIERLFGARLKRKLFEGGDPIELLPVQEGFSSPYIWGIIFSIAGVVFHNVFFYSFSFGSLTSFVLLVVPFLFFLNSGFYKEFSKTIFQKTLQGEPEGKIIEENNRLRSYVASALPIESEQCYPHVLVVTTAFLLETIVAPIFLFLVGGYFLFWLYFWLYLMLVIFRLQNKYLLGLYRGFLFLPGIFSVFLFAFSAFAAGKSFGKVSVAGLLNLRDAFSGFDRLLLLNVRTMLAVLETKLAFRYGGKDYIFDFGEEKLNQRTFILLQRLLGIQKFLTYVFSYYLYIVL